MMTLVNSRMVYYHMHDNITNVTVTVSDDELSTDHRRSVFSTAHGGISVTREEWTDEESSSHGQGAKGSTFAGNRPLDSRDTNVTGTV